MCHWVAQLHHASARVRTRSTYQNAKGSEIYSYNAVSWSGNRITLLHIFEIPKAHWVFV